MSDDAREVEGGPSEAAVEAGSWAETMEHGRLGYDAARAVLAAAHDPALGLDRSVRLGDVVEWLRRHAPPGTVAGDWFDKLAESCAREFGGPTHAAALAASPPAEPTYEWRVTTLRSRWRVYGDAAIAREQCAKARRRGYPEAALERRVAPGPWLRVPDDEGRRDG
jgi:hypothetical protein